MPDGEADESLLQSAGLPRSISPPIPTYNGRPIPDYAILVHNPERVLFQTRCWCVCRPRYTLEE
jgi:hypothetical protein